MEIKFVKPDYESIKYIAENMRQSDIDEVWSVNHFSPFEALLDGFELSNFQTILIINGLPSAMFGLVIHDALTGEGVPWMLGTQDLTNHKRAFIKLSDDVINEMLEICPVLFNYVSVENVVTINWLKRLGFTIGTPHLYGVDNGLFHKFHLIKR